MDEGRKYPEEDPELDLRLIPLQNALAEEYARLAKGKIREMQNQINDGERAAYKLIRALVDDELSEGTHNLSAVVKTLRREQKLSNDWLERLERQRAYIGELKLKTEVELIAYVEQKIRGAQTINGSRNREERTK